MPPLDMQTCSGASGLGQQQQQQQQKQHTPSSSGPLDSLRSLAEAAAASPKSAVMSPEAAGERRRSRALKLKQTRSRNAAAAAAAAANAHAARNQVYTSAEESDYDVSYRKGLVHAAGGGVAEATTRRGDVFFVAYLFLAPNTLKDPI